VPFVELPPHLLAARRVTLCGGVARVAGAADLGALLLSWFTAHLRRSMATGAATPPMLEGGNQWGAAVVKLACGKYEICQDPQAFRQ